MKRANNRLGIVIAIVLGIVAVVVAVIVGSLAFTDMSIRATQTAEARVALATPAPSATVVVMSTSTLRPADTAMPALTNTPSPTASPTDTPSPISTPSGVLIDDFELGIDNWYAARRKTDGWGRNEVAMNIFQSPDAAVGNGALKCDFDFGQVDDPYPRATCFRVNLPIQDWGQYRSLQFKAKSLVDLNTNIRVFIALATREDSCWNELGDFRILDRSYQTLTFNLDRASYKTCNDFQSYDQALLGKDHVVRLHLIFTAEHRPAGAVLIDEVWLLK